MAKDVTNADPYPNGGETATHPTMFSQETHGDSGKKTKSNRKTKEGQKEKGRNDDEEQLEPFFGSGFKKSACFLMFSQEVEKEDDRTGCNSDSNPQRQKSGTGAEFGIILHLRGKKDDSHP
jgi:hypothetical protein